MKLTSPKFILFEIANTKNTKKILNISFLEIKNSFMFLKKLKIVKNKYFLLYLNLWLKMQYL